MDEHLLYLRQEYGDVFATQLPTGQTIPWRPLTAGEFLEYNVMFQAGQYPVAYIENEIFRKCVLDGAFVRSINKQKAGVIQTVVSCIMAFSGPQNVNDLNQHLNMARHMTSDAMHDLVSFVCQAFPSYKPEEVYAMDYKTLMLRAAQGERKMLGAGFIQEPLSFEAVNESAEDQAAAVEERQKRLEENQDMINKYYEQQGIKIPESVKQARKDMRERIIDHPAPPPVPEAKLGEQTIISTSDMAEHEAFMTGHEQDIVNKIRATGETAQFYTEYLDQLQEDGKLKMLTPEERKAAAEKRMEANKQKILERRKQAFEDAKKELPELLKVREEARRRKAKKAARRR